VTARSRLPPLPRRGLAVTAAIDAETPGQVRRLIAMVVEKVTIKDRVDDRIHPRPEAIASFASPDPDLAAECADGPGGA
jgi:hypothetical protein